MTDPSREGDGAAGARSADPGPPGGAAGSTRRPEIDWRAAERSPEFKQLIAKRRRFVLPATIFFLVWYFGFVALAGYAPDFMGTSVYQGLTVGYVLALSQFVMVWGLGFWYIKRADRDFDPLARRAAQKAVDVGGQATPSGRSGEVTSR